MGRGRNGGRFVDRVSKSFTVSGTPTINLGTFDGAILVQAWDKSEVSYVATKRANSDESLRQISLEANQQGSLISITARANRDRDNGTVELQVNVPRNANLHLSSDDGRLRIEGVSGQLVARTGDGSIEVSGGKGRVEVNTGDGHIKISSFDGEIDARTGDGSINLEGSFTAVAAHTGDGSITLGVPANSNFVIETNAEDLTNEGVTMSEEVAPSARVKRWRVGRGGPVFTLNTSDGSVVIRSH
jgi:hypothetical protein